MIELHHYRFLMHLEGGFKNDTWMLYGQVWNHPAAPDGSYLYISTPTEFVNDNTIKTCSGKTYILVDPDGEAETIHQEIRDVVQRGGYSRH